ncbi:hypothetical protein [Gloeothece citriformis]|nr:hypothetical protein [Gloeothece citriformis]
MIRATTLLSTIIFQKKGMLSIAAKSAQHNPVYLARFFMFTKKPSLLILSSLLLIIVNSFMASPSLAKPTQICLSSSIENINLEIQLIDQINRIKLNAEKAVNELEVINREIDRYSKNINTINEIGGKIAGWDRTIIGIYDSMLSDYVNIPGVEFNLRGKTGISIDADQKIISENRQIINISSAKLILDLSGVLEMFTPSNLADWITGTSLSIAETKLAITSNAAEASSVLSEKLKDLRQKCEQEYSVQNSDSNVENNELENNELENDDISLKNSPSTTVIQLTFSNNNYENVVAKRDNIIKQLNNPYTCSYFQETQGQIAVGLYILYPTNQLSMLSKLLSNFNDVYFLNTQMELDTDGMKTLLYNIPDTNNLQCNF